MRIAALVGTRPETIKLIPVIKALQMNANLKVRLWSSGQHPEAIASALDLFGMNADLDFKVFQKDQTPSDTVGLVLLETKTALDLEQPSLLIVQGDTSTAVAGALAGFYGDVGVIHVEAGLRSFDRNSPFPEEVNRRLISSLADLHLAPNASAQSHLIDEGVEPESIHVVGNPGIDMLVNVLGSVKGNLQDPINDYLTDGSDIVLVTMHRRENIGQPLVDVCAALNSLSARRKDLQVLFPVHPNPRIQSIVREQLGGSDRIHLLDPVGYSTFVRLLETATLVLSDSGGVQEEATFLNKPLLILRDRTERTISESDHLVRLVDSNTAAIVEEATSLIENHRSSRQISESKLNDYQMAAPRIAGIIATFAAQRACVPSKEGTVLPIRCDGG